MNEKLTIQEMAQLTGLSRDTLRYYEKIGLIDSVERAANGHRRYSKRDIGWVEFLNRLRATGMPIMQMCCYADLRRQGDSTLTERRQLLEAHSLKVETHILEWMQSLAAVREKIETYRQMEENYHAEHNNPI